MYLMPSAITWLPLLMGIILIPTSSAYARMLFIWTQQLPICIVIASSLIHSLIYPAPYAILSHFLNTIRK